MTKRFELKTNFLNGHADIVDWVESEQKDAICIFNDLGVLPFSSAPSVCNLLNQFNDENEQLKQSINNLKNTIIKITIAYQRKYNRTVVDLVDEVYDEDITDLIKELQE